MLGVDVGKTELHGTWRDATSQQIRWQGAVPNTGAGIARLLAQAPGSAVVVEPTGRYGEALIRAAQAAGRSVLLAAPRQARAFLWATHPRAKTDRVDSAGLALYGLTGRLRPYVLPSDDVDEIKQLLAARRGLSQSRSALQQQQAALPRAAATLRPAITALSQQIAAIDRQVARLAPTPAPTPAPAPARAATALVPGAGAAAPATSQRDARTSPAAAPPPTPVLAAARRLRAVPGVGPVTAVALAVCLVEKQFTHPDQFVAYVGLDLRVQQSGRRRGQVGLSKQGDADLRRLLYLAAMSAARSTRDRTFADRYAREQAKGLAKTQALNAVARKLAKVAWSLVTHRSAYNPARVHHQHPAALDTQP